MKALPSSERLTRIRELFEELSGLPIEERTEVLESACERDAGLREEVAALLRESGPAEARFEHLNEAVLAPALARLREDPLVGSTVAHYEILAPIGRGGMGIVYQARDRTLGRVVALKVLPQELNVDVDARRRFMQEAQTASALEHPNIATVHEIGETKDHQLFIAMAYYPGESLQNVLKYGPLPEERALDYAIQLAGALTVAHRHDVIHRDLKPGNIIVTANDTLKLLDFGLAKFSGNTEHTRIGIIAGTVAYMSPEQAGGRLCDSRTDIWALGVVLYEMLTGEQPFAGENPQAVIRAILETEAAGLAKGERTIPPRWRPVIRRCLEKNPAKRYASMDAVLEDLKRIREGQVATGQKFAAIKHFNKLKGFLVVAFLAAAVLSIGIFMLRPSQVVPSRTISADPKALAVLPLSNLSPDPENAFFADGVHEDILTSLASIRSLRVIARSSVIEYAERKASPEAIASELGVRYLVEGSVRREADQVRVSARLLDTETGTYTWAGTFDRELVSIFQLQSEVALAVAGALKGEMIERDESRLGDVRTDSIEAYDAFIQARELLLNRDTNEFPANFPHIYSGFERATILDPGFHSAWVYQVYNCSWALFRIEHGHLEVDPDLLLTRAEAALDRVLEIDPENPLTEFAKGCFAYYAKNDYKQAIEHFSRCIEANPLNHLAHSLMAHVFEKQGDFRGALRHLRIANEFDPRSLNTLRSMRFIYGVLGRFPEAIGICERICSIDPDAHPTRQYMHFIRFSITADEAEVMRNLELVQKGLLTPENHFERIWWTLTQAGRWDLLERLMKDFDISRIPSPYEREKARRINCATRVFLAQQAGDPELVRTRAGEGLEMLASLNPELEDVFHYHSAINIYRTRFHMILGNREAAEAAYAESEIIWESAMDESPFNRSLFRFHQACALAELDPDAAFDMLLELDEAEVSPWRLCEVFALPYIIPGLFESPRVQNYARIYEDGRWVPYLTKHGFLQ